MDIKPLAVYMTMLRPKDPVLLIAPFGEMNIPDPMIVPTFSATAMLKPNSFFNLKTSCCDVAPAIALNEESWCSTV